MAPHEERVIGERNELAEKIGKLSSFMGMDKWLEINEVDRVLLIQQRGYMEGYLKMLNKRIDRFPTD